ncbi:hypothetical protein [Rhodobacter sp. SY28-1]|uniref:hypothetical protein n=1 Tax=Rhodobacter sp. SY28-1 TaxID=2562317 RepID=UPI0010C015F4|nr:hypothetical protein [Rhodobacter sp. SY28-1]
MIHWFVSIAVVVAVAFGTEALVDSWLGEARRLWIGLGGLALLVLSGALVKASGVEAMTRYLRSAMVGAGIGAALDKAGLRLGWLRSLLRLFGIETKPQATGGAQGPRVTGWLLWSGWAALLVGLGMVWTGMFGG